MVENRPNLKSMLRHEELASKERATAVMNRIMASGSQELKVITLERSKTEAGTHVLMLTVLDQCSD